MPMTQNDTIQMMRRCSEEIKSLRREIADLQPKAQAYEDIRAILGLMPRSNIGMAEDLAWRLDLESTKLEAELKAETGHD